MEAELTADLAYRQNSRLNTTRSPMPTIPSAISDTSLTPDFHLTNIISEGKRDLRRQRKRQQNYNTSRLDKITQIFAQ